MKIYKNLFLLGLFASATLISCDSDDDNTPEILNEEEIITTLNFTISPDESDDVLMFQLRDLDGDGPNPPVMTVPDQNLQAATTYTGFVSVWNETVTPPENITEEVEEEADEHQFFYTPGGGVTFTDFNSLDFDENGNPIGIDFNFTTGDAQSGTLTITLRHELEKPNEGLESAGGDTDVEVTFPVTVE